jgi:site-specific recombinase XerD
MIMASSSDSLGRRGRGCFTEQSDVKPARSGQKSRDSRKLRQHVTGLYVFETERGGPLSVDALQYMVREAGRLGRLDLDVHPHMLRHTAGCCLANQGVDTRLIQDSLGHADIRQTAHYTALSPKRLAVRVR